MVAHKEENWRGPWLRSQRLALPAPKGKRVTQEQMAKRLSAAGIPLDRTAYNKLENAGRISDELLSALAGYFGVPVPTPVEPPPSETTSLASALVILAEELQAIRLERERWEVGVVAMLRAYEGGQVPIELLDALAPPRPVDVPR